jgi:PIN domain nuclease of toxin-antitoxin system
VRLLLDTHALLWAAEGRLAGPGREAVEKDAEAVFVSAVTVWEIEIKRALGRLRAPAELLELLDESGFERLPISLEHAREAGRLAPLHADPFDRMLVAQARVEAMTLATADDALARYGAPVLGVARA